LQGLGNLYQGMSRFALAEPPLRQAVKLAHAIWRVFPTSLTAGQLRASALEYLASFLWTAGRSQEAEKVYEDLAEFYETLHQQSPQVLGLALGRARVLDNLGRLNEGRGHVREAEQYFAQEIQLLEPLQHAQPKNVILVELLTTARLNFGELQWWSCGQPARASEAFLKA